MKIKTFTAAVALTTAFSASGASALTLEFDGFTNGYKTVNVATPSHNGAAGAFNMKDATSSLVVFCLDIIGKIYSNTSYEYTATNTPFSNSVNLVANGGLDRIQRLFDSGFDTALNDNVASAGFQVALWNAVYDDDWSVANGAGFFYQTAANDGVRDAANAFLQDAQTYGGPNMWDLTYLEGATRNSDGSRSQNLVTAAPSAVPLPAAGLMLITAFGGLFVARRRKTG